MMRSVSRPIQLLESRIVPSQVDRSFSARIFLVDPESGLTGVLRLDAETSTMSVPPTPAEQEWFRTHTLSKRHRAPIVCLRSASNGDATLEPPIQSGR